MKLFKRTALATAIAFTAILPTIESAEAAPYSYLSYVEKYSAYPEIQLNFINSMIANYTRTVATFEGILTRYARFSGYSFYTNIQNQTQWYRDELARWEEQLALVTGNSVEEVTVTNTEVVSTVQYEQLRGTPTEVSSDESVVEETIEDMVYVYAVLTTVLRTEITTNEITTTTTTTYYSDNTSTSESDSRVTATEIRYDEETVVNRELINQYAVVTEPESNDGTGTPTLNVMTRDEYLARDDVDYAGTDAYVNAMRKAKSWMFDSYIRNEDGMYYLYGKTLDTVKAPDAWARGWTGKGTKIAILDTGIDLDHTEFAGRIVDGKCFAYCVDGDDTNYSDDNGHGTHVAGIAAGALDGNGSTGVAFDAEILVAKVAAANGAYHQIGMANALAWASNNGATVANISGGYTVSPAYSGALTEIAPGDWKMIDHGENNTDYQQIYINGTYDSYGEWDAFRMKYDFDPLKVMSETFANSELVAVVAAGNNGKQISAFPGQYSYITNPDGSLMFDGRIIVAGSWDQQEQTLAWYSNAAGTVCVDNEYLGDTCANSAYRVKDFYLMAPGSYVMSADDDGGFIAMSGTSQAAPIISGAAALIHQMWPHMTGSNIVQVLLQSANKDLPGYDENVHGQGLLDLEAATRPMGDLGIPTGGRADGTVAELSGGIALGGSTVSSITTLDNVMVLDAFDRDFYFDANASIAKIDTRTMSYTEAHKDKINTNAYAGYGSTMNGGTENLLIGASEDMKSLNVAYDFDNGVSIGYLKEEDTFLGNSAKSSLMKVDGAQTVYMGYNASHDSGNLTIFGGATVAFTKANVDDSAMMKSMDTLVSNTANIGAELSLTANSSVGLVAALPVAITSGSANFKAAQSIDANGDIQYANVSSSLAGDAREYNVGAYYNFTEAKQYGDVEISAYVEERMNYLGQSGESDTAGGIKLKVRF